MLISHSKEFIFIHIYKVAGTSIEKALGPYNNESLWSSSPADIVKFLIGLYPKVYGRSLQWGHQTAMEVREMCPVTMFDSYFKFAFVRNPYDWMISLYHYMKNDPTHPHYQKQHKMSLYEYLQWYINENCILQSDFVYDSTGALIVDLIGKYENLQNDFHTVCDAIKIKRITLPVLNRSGHDKYVTYYDEKCEDLVYSSFRKDFDKFGYSRMRQASLR